MILRIPASIERRLNAYVQAVDGEIAGMGKVEMRDDGALWVTDIAIYEQEVTGGTADLSTEALAKFQTDLIKKGESPKQWYLWWHSHNTFGAFFSGTDTGTIQSSTEFDHIVSLVVNKKRERMCRLDTHRPFRLVAENVKIEIIPEINHRTIEIEAEIRRLSDEVDVKIAPLMEEMAGIQNEIPGGIEALKDEVKEKVKIRSFQRDMGFARERNAQGNRSWLDSESMDDSWSNKRKKDGAVTITLKEVIEGRYDKDEIEVLTEAAGKLILAHRANGNGDTAECAEMERQLQQWQQLIVDLNEGTYDDGEQYWTGLRWERYMDYEPLGNLGIINLLASPYYDGYKDEK